jgi:hypothetical protein
VVTGLVLTISIGGVTGGISTAPTSAILPLRACTNSSGVAQTKSAAASDSFVETLVMRRSKAPPMRARHVGAGLADVPDATAALAGVSPKLCPGPVML